MNLRKLILTQNDCYKAGRTIVPKGIMVHSTGANNPELRRYVGPDDGLLGKNQYNNHWNQARPDGQQKCVHAFIGKLADGSIATYQTLPWDMRGWHAGGKANDTHIGFEICEDGLKDRAYFDRVYKEAVDLCAYLCRQFGLTEKNIIDHIGGYRMGIASGHSDVGHWFPKHGKSMDTFRADVKKDLQGGVVVAVFKDLANHWAKGDIEWLAERGIVAKDANFRPNDTITRSETAALLKRAIEYAIKEARK